jgi:hypothetical protein
VIAVARFFLRTNSPNFFQDETNCQPFSGRDQLYNNFRTIQICIKTVRPMSESNWLKNWKFINGLYIKEYYPACISSPDPQSLQLMMKNQLRHFWKNKKAAF